LNSCLALSVVKYSCCYSQLIVAFQNLAHCSYEAGILEDPDVTPPSDMWKLTVDPLKAPDKPEDFTVVFEKGIPKKLITEGRTITDSVELFLTTNAIARRHGVGRIDIVENRFIGLKSRGCYETPGLTCLRAAHIDLEGLVLDREVRALRDQFVTFNYSKILYNGLFRRSVSSSRSQSLPARKVSMAKSDAGCIKAPSSSSAGLLRRRSCTMPARALWTKLEILLLVIQLAS
jgi:argininosuccinate synthase